MNEYFIRPYQAAFVRVMNLFRRHKVALRRNPYPDVEPEMVEVYGKALWLGYTWLKGVPET